MVCGLSAHLLSVVGKETNCSFLFGYDEHRRAPFRFLNSFKNSNFDKSHQFLLERELVYTGYHLAFTGLELLLNSMLTGVVFHFPNVPSNNVSYCFNSSSSICF